MNICLAFIILFIIDYTSSNGIPENPSYFEKVARSTYFVDKTMFLEEFYGPHNRTVISCPKNFGKTTMLDMVRRFFEIPYDKKTGKKLPENTSHYHNLFGDKSLNLRIAQHDDFVRQHQGQHAVLYFNFSGIRGDSEDEILSSMRHRIRHIFKSHQWLFEIMEQRHAEDEFDIFGFELNRFERVLNKKINRKIILQGFNTLVEFLRHHFKTRVIVLVDDYDIPIMHALNIGESAKQINDLIHAIFFVFVKSTDYVSHTMITGRSRMFKEDVYIDHMFMFHYSHFLQDYGICRNYAFFKNYELAEYFGFTESEVDQLLAKKNTDPAVKSKIKSYFNGYRIKRTMRSLYQPKGVVKYLETNNVEEDDYTYDLVPKIMRCLKHRKFFEQACELFSKKRLTAIIVFSLTRTALTTLPELVNTDCAYQRENTPYFTPFLDNGYLCYTRDEDEYEIPNEIAEKKLRREFEKFYWTTFNITITNSYVATSFNSIFHVENTTDEMLANLADSFQQLMQYRKQHYLEEFEFYKIIFGAITSNSKVHANIIVKRENGTRECVFDSIDRLKFIDDERKILLIIKLTYDKNANEAATEARNYVPHRLRNRTAVKMIKYLGINLNKQYKVEIQKAENRYDWYFT